MVDRYEIRVVLEGQDNLSSSLNKVDSALGKLKKDAGSSSSGIESLNNKFNSLNNVLNASVFGFSALQLAKKVGEVVELGQAVSLARGTFEALTGGTEGANRALQAMRQSTGGIVDDLHLLQSGSQLLQTGLAQTGDQVARLQGLAVKLGAAVGQGPVEAIDNLNSALLNNSFVRLDTLGISANRVRERVNELKQAGLDMTSAFAQAVLEQGEEAIAGLGDAADGSSTAVKRLSVDLQNLGESISEDVAGNIEIAAQNAEGLIDQLGVIAGFAAQGVYDVAVNVGLTSDRTVGDFEQARLGSAGEAQRLRNQQAAQQREAERQRIAQEQEAETQRLTAAGQRSRTQNASLLGDRREQRLLVAGLADDQAALVTSTNQLTQSQNENRLSTQTLTANVGRLQVEQQAAGEQEALRLNVLDGMTASMGGLENAYTDLTRKTQQLDLFGSLETDFTQLQDTFQAGQLQFGGLTFFDPDKLDAVVSRADELQQQADELATLAAESDFEFITQDQVDRAREIANEAGNLADEAQRASDAFNNASLDQLLGISGGGALAQLTDTVLSGIENEDVKAATQHELDISSGRATALGDYVEGELSDTIATIAEEVGPEAAAAATERALNAIREGRAAGLSEEQIVANTQQAVGFQLRPGQGSQQQLVPLVDLQVEATKIGDYIRQGIGAQAGAFENIQGGAQGGGRGIVRSGRGPLAFGRVDVTDENVSASGSLEMNPDNTYGVGTIAVEDSDVSATGTMAVNSETVSAVGTINIDNVSIAGGVSLDQGDTGGVTPKADVSLTGTGRHSAGGGGFKRPGQGDTATAGGEDTGAFATADDVYNVTTIQESLVTISELDLGIVLDPFIADLNNADDLVARVQNSLVAITSAVYKATIPLEIILEDKTGLKLGQNPAFGFAIDYYFNYRGVDINRLATL